MKKFIRFQMAILISIAILSFTGSCAERQKENGKEIAIHTSTEKPIIETPKKELSADFKAYWYAGNAEITSYQLTQARYGELREGKAVLVYVTEPFLAGKQVKADRNNPDNIPVIKLNSTKKYLTGIYPYSIMSSSFYPVTDDQHAVKVSTSVQEWCGHVYAQLNNRERFEINSHSYFETEADQHVKLDKNILENELWNKIRIDPHNLPIGTIKMIPSLEYIRLGHKEIKAYDATAKLTDNGTLNSYEVHYPELKRTLVINYTKDFPYTIESWSEIARSGFGPNAKLLTSTAKKI
ncbi:MAG: septum formation inhibitor Maf, partial [Bacteroidota bacterium]